MARVGFCWSGNQSNRAALAVTLLLAPIGLAAAAGAPLGIGSFLRQLFAGGVRRQTRRL